MGLVICPYLSIGGRIEYLCVVNVHGEFNFQNFMSSFHSISLSNSTEFPALFAAA